MGGGGDRLLCRESVDRCRRHRSRAGHIGRRLHCGGPAVEVREGGAGHHVLMRITAFALALAALAGAVSHAHTARTRVVVLGTGTPNADPDRFGPAVAVVVDDASYLV